MQFFIEQKVDEYEQIVILLVTHTRYFETEVVISCDNQEKRNRLIS